MQEVQNNTATYMTGDSNNTKAQQNPNSTLFKSLLNNQSLPSEITYDQYKNLTTEDINNLYPKDTMKEENEKAMALHKKVNISDDEILNQVLFERELDVQDYEVGQRALGMIDFLSKTWDLATSFESYELTDKYMSENNIPFSREKFAEIQQKMEKTIVYDENKKMTAEELFEIFDNNKLGYEAYIEFYNYTPDSEEYQNYQEQIAYRESIKATYQQKVDENKALLASYTRTTTSPTQTITDNIVSDTTTELSDAEKALFNSIVEDKYVTYEEVEDLSYDQIQQLKDFIMQKDEDGNYIKRTLLDSDRKAGILISTTAISSNTNFNKAIFNTVKKIDDEKVLETFMYDLTGTEHSEKLIAYPELQVVDYSKEDVGQFVQKQITSYQIKVDTAVDEETKEYYQDILNMYNGLNKTYRALNGESLTEGDPLEKLRELVADIVSMFKTGYTVSELEYIEQLLEEIRKLLKERNSGDSDISDKEINEQIKAIEKALLALEKRLNGEAVIEMDDETNVSSSDDKNSNLSSGPNFEARLDMIQKRVDEMKNGKYNQPTDSSIDDEEKLEEEKEW